MKSMWIGLAVCASATILNANAVPVYSDNSVYDSGAAGYAEPPMYPPSTAQSAQMLRPPIPGAPPPPRYAPQNAPADYANDSLGNPAPSPANGLSAPAYGNRMPTQRGYNRRGYGYGMPQRGMYRGQGRYAEPPMGGSGYYPPGPPDAAPGAGPYSGGRAYPAPAPGWSQPGPQNMPAEPGPDELLRAGIDDLSHFLQSEGASDPDALHQYLSQQVAPYFDFRKMARWAAGVNYRRMNEEQRAVFTGRLGDMFMDALARNLGTYAQPLPRIDVFHLRSAKFGDEVTVRALVTPRGGYALKLDFSFSRADDGRWRVFDVAANGNSAVTYYRGYFARLARGGGIEALLQ